MSQQYRTNNIVHGCPNNTPSIPSDAEYGDSVPTTPMRYVFIDKKWLAVDRFARNLVDNECVYLLNNKWSEDISCDDLMRETLPRKLTEDEIQILRTKQAKFVGVAITWWVIPLISIYIFGLGVAWVISGFRKK